MYFSGREGLGFPGESVTLMGTTEVEVLWNTFHTFVCLSVYPFVHLSRVFLWKQPWEFSDFFCIQSGDILDLYCIRLLSAAPFCQNYAKLYYDAKHLEKGLNREEWNFYGPFFIKSALSGQYRMLPSISREDSLLFAKVPKNSWCSFDWPLKDEMLS